MTARLVRLITEFVFDVVPFYVSLFYVHVGSQYRKASIILAYFSSCSIIVVSYIGIIASCIIGPSYQDIFSE